MQAQVEQKVVRTGLVGQPPLLPKGVILVEWNPRSGQVVFDQQSVVGDVPAYLRWAVLEVARGLRKPSYAAAHQPLVTLLGRLRLCGLWIEVENENGEDDE